MEATLQNSKTLHLYRAKGLELFYKNGYFNTSLKDICNSLSISNEAFVESFISKEEFFIGITQSLVLQKTLNLLIEPVTYKQSPFPLILDMLEAELDEAVSNEVDNGFLLGNFISEFNNRNLRINKYLVDIIKIWEINLISLLRKGQLDGYVISSFMGIRTLMVDGSSRLLADQYLQQLRYYFYSISSSYGR